jgi:hypothetical protein
MKFMLMYNPLGFFEWIGGVKAATERINYIKREEVETSTKTYYKLNESYSPELCRSEVLLIFNLNRKDQKSLWTLKNRNQPRVGSTKDPTILLLLNCPCHEDDDINGKRCW